MQTLKMVSGRFIMAFSTLCSDILNFFFPELCAACQEHLLTGEKVLCIRCILHLPETGCWKNADNSIAKQFWGKVPLHTAVAWCHFGKGTGMQRMIHQLKYKNRPDIGLRLGQLCAGALSQGDIFGDPDLIVPVPLHPAKQKGRGYNQAACFGRGLSEVWELPLREDVLRRVKNTSSQTRKHRFERSANVERVFEVSQDRLQGIAHVLLVDDVLTTGSTLAAAATELLKVPGLKVSVLTLAFARA